MINFPADPAGYARTMQSILVSYSFIMFLREYEAQNLGGGQLTVLERIKGHGVQYFASCSVIFLIFLH